MIIDEVITEVGDVVVNITMDDGKYYSMLKSTWEELQAQKELGGTL